jgi:hypothetical protein
LAADEGGNLIGLMLIGLIGLMFIAVLIGLMFIAVATLSDR